VKLLKFWEAADITEHFLIAQRNAIAFSEHDLASKNRSSWPLQNYIFRLSVGGVALMEDGFLDEFVVLEAPPRYMLPLK